MTDSSESNLLAEFPPVATAQWEDVIRKDLRGADYAKNLIWQTDEQIRVKPYYRNEDLRDLEYLDTLPGQFPYTRGTGFASGWKIRECIHEPTVARANRAARSALAAGAEEICFVTDDSGIGLRAPEDLAALLDGISLESVPVHFESAGGADSLLRFLVGAFQWHAQAGAIRGSINYEPDGEFVEAASLVRAVLAAAPGFRPLTVGGYRFQDAGSTIVQELGFSLAKGVEYLARLIDSGMTVDQAAMSLVFSFAVGSNYFFEIAKLRAARTLWARVVESFQPAKQESAKAVIHARTSRWNMTIYDSHVNILRATTESMAAAIGGCDSLWVVPFDDSYREPDEFSRHLARNTQIILKKEAWLDRSNDAAGGSWYIECLTNSIARESWKLLQEIEAAGGFWKAWESGLIPLKMEQSREAKLGAAASRRRSIVGTNQYPNLQEQMLSKVERPDAAERAASVFERIRLRTERHGANGRRVPRFLLLEIGDLTMRKARSGFILNFFGCAGFQIETAAFADMDSAVQGVLERKPDAVVVCSSDAEYPQFAGPIISRLRAANSEVPVLLAGHPSDTIEQLRRDGVADFVHIRSNAAEVLTAWQDKLGVKE